MYVGITYLNCFQLLLQLLVLVEKNFPLFLTNLLLALQIFMQVVVGILKKDDKPEDIRT
jgi:hypothetical protein